MKFSRISLLVVPAFVLALVMAPAARAEEGQGQDLTKQIQKKMEKILELMKRNEEALLKLSTGQKAKTERVDIEPPPPDGSNSSGSDANGSDSNGSDSNGSKANGSGGKSGNGNSEGAEAVRKIEEILRAQGGTIPDELKQLVEMIPL